MTVGPPDAPLTGPPPSPEEDALALIPILALELCVAGAEELALPLLLLLDETLPVGVTDDDTVGSGVTDGDAPVLMEAVMVVCRRVQGEGRGGELDRVQTYTSVHLQSHHNSETCICACIY